MSDSNQAREVLLNSIKNKLNLLPKLKTALQEGRTNEKNVLLNSWNLLQAMAIKAFFIDHQVELTKKFFNKCGLLDEVLIVKYDEKILSFGLNHFSYVLLSDNKELINRFANIRDSSFDELVEQGVSAPMLAFQSLLKDDMQEFERAMFYVRSKSVPKFKMELDAMFYEAMAEKNKSKIESVLAAFVADNNHAARNKEHTTINSFVSHPAIGYAKLAWLKGLEVEVKSNLVPRELLVIAPLEVYEDIDVFSLAD